MTTDASTSSSLLVQHADRAPPLGALLAAHAAGVAVETKVDPRLPKGAEPVLVLPGGRDKLEGLAAISRYVARVAPSESGLYPPSVSDSVKVDGFLDFAQARLRNGPGLEKSLEPLEEYLALRTRLVGDDGAAAGNEASSSTSSSTSSTPSPSRHSLPSVADYACWGALQSSGMWTKLRRRFPHVSRWHSWVGSTAGASELAEKHGLAFKSAFQLSKEREAAGLGGGTSGSFDVGLPNAVKGKVVTRFPPEPSGYLHVGHAKAAMLNDFFAKHYEGQMILRFDDTNPEKESTEFTDSILADLKTLGVEWSRLTYTSDYFPQLLELGELLIKAGHCYADDTPTERMREERMAGVESARRDRPVEESLAAWREMAKGSEEGKTNCIRFRMDMKHDNRALRDPVAYRCNDTPHWRTGEKYKVYPTYDCACPFVDAYEGVTHALRTSEYKDREEQTKWALRLQQSVWNTDEKRRRLPDFDIWDYSRLAFAGTVMSKRKLTELVLSHKVSGWDDPRFPTVRGVLRRGLTVAALREFILSQGASKNVTLQEFDKLWALNRAIIDPTAPRHTAVRSKGKICVALDGAPAVGSPDSVVDVPKHKKNLALGSKKSYRTPQIWLDASDAASIAPGEEVTLMDWGNAFVDEVDLAKGTGKGRLHLEGSVKATRLKLTWLPAAPEDPSVPPLTPVTLVDHGDLLTKRKLEEGEKLEDFANPCSRWEEGGVADAGVSSLEQNDVIQLERLGFYRVDSAFGSRGERSPAVLIRIPDGKKGPPPPPEAVEAAKKAVSTA